MKRLLGSTLIAGALVVFVVLLWRGRLGKITLISSESKTSGSATFTSTFSEIDVNWHLVMPLILIATIGTILLLWRRRRSPTGT
ncbi:MAG: hypothetical protein H7144_01335 [Burkholderiales bacterium]|nr:hypothetical protein [Phycisphaerae bacterium]